jgi:hypothetical protein
MSSKADIYLIAAAFTVIILSLIAAKENWI